MSVNTPVQEDFVQVCCCPSTSPKGICACMAAVHGKARVWGQTSILPPALLYTESPADL